MYVCGGAPPRRRAVPLPDGGSRRLRGGPGLAAFGGVKSGRGVKSADAAGPSEPNQRVAFRARPSNRACHSESAGPVRRARLVWAAAAARWRSRIRGARAATEGRRRLVVCTSESSVPLSHRCWYPFTGIRVADLEGCGN